MVAGGQDHALALRQAAQVEQALDGGAGGQLRVARRRLEIDREDIAQQRHAAARGGGARQAVDRHLAAVARQPACGGAGFGQRQDRPDLDLAGQEHAGQGDGLVGAGQVAVAGGQVQRRFELAFGGGADARHGGHRLHRVPADRRLGREHHRIGAVDHGIGHVQHFGAGGDGRVDHRLQHLGGGDHGPVAADGDADDLLLQAGQLGVVDLHAQIAARDHHGIAGIDNLVQVGDRLGALDLGDHVGIAAGGLQQRARQFDVGGAAAEGDGNEIHAQLGGQQDVVAVLVGEGIQGQAAAEPVQALAVGEHGVGEHVRVHLRAVHRGDLQADQAVIQQQGVADGDIAGQAGIADANAAGIAGRCIGAAVQDEPLAGLERDRAVGETLDADLRAAQVAEHGDFPVQRGGGIAHQPAAAPVLVGIAVGEVDAHDIDPGIEQAAHPLRAVGGRAEGGDDLGAAFLTGHGADSSRCRCRRRDRRRGRAAVAGLTRR